MKICTLTLLIFFSQIAYGQEFNLDSLFKVFQNDIETEQAYNDGRVVWGDYTRENFYLLMIVSPVDSLIKYINHSNPAIKYFIFSGLINKNADEEIMKEIANNHINDTASFQNSPTDVVLTWTVSEYMQMSLKHRNDSRIDYEERIKKIRQTPRISLNGERHGRISKENLLKVDSLYLNNSDFKIISFSMTYKKKSKFIETKSENNKLTSEMKQKIKKLKSTNEMYFENIKVVGPDGSTRIMAPIKIEIE